MNDHLIMFATAVFAILAVAAVCYSILTRGKHH